MKQEVYILGPEETFISEVVGENINFLENGNLGYVQANAAIRSFYKELLESSVNK